MTLAENKPVVRRVWAEMVGGARRSSEIGASLLG